MTPEHRFRKILIWGVNRLHGNDLKSVRGKNIAAEAMPVPTSKRILAKYDVAFGHRSFDRELAWNDQPRIISRQFISRNTGFITSPTR